MHKIDNKIHSRFYHLEVVHIYNSYTYPRIGNYNIFKNKNENTVSLEIKRTEI